MSFCDNFVLKVLDCLYVCPHFLSSCIHLGKQPFSHYTYIYLMFHKQIFVTSYISIMNRNNGSLPISTIIITLVVFVLYIISHHDCKTCNCHT